jgi:chromosome segregation ATPase
MLKKLVIAAAAVVVGLVILKKTDLGSLMQVWWKDAMTCVRKQVPPETRIKQLKMEIGKIDEDIKTAVNALVKQEAIFEALKKETGSVKDRLTGLKTDMTALIDVLEKDNTRVSFKGQDFSPEAAQAKLDRFRAEYEVAKENLKVKEQLLRTKTEQLTLADQRISKIKDKKTELTEQVAKLESQLELLRLKQMENRIEVNDSQVSKCEALQEDPRNMLREEEIRAEKYARYGLTPATPTTIKENERSRAESIKAAKAALNEKPAGEQ